MSNVSRGGAGGTGAGGGIGGAVGSKVALSTAVVSCSLFAAAAATALGLLPALQVCQSSRQHPQLRVTGHELQAYLAFHPSR